MTKKDLTILLSYNTIFQMLTNCNNNNNILLQTFQMTKKKYKTDSTPCKSQCHTTTTHHKLAISPNIQGYFSHSIDFQIPNLGTI